MLEHFFDAGSTLLMVFSLSVHTILYGTPLRTLESVQPALLTLIDHAPIVSETFELVVYVPQLSYQELLEQFRQEYIMRNRYLAETGGVGLVDFEPLFTVVACIILAILAYGCAQIIWGAVSKVFCILFHRCRIFIAKFRGSPYTTEELAFLQQTRDLMDTAGSSNENATEVDKKDTPDRLVAIIEELSLLKDRFKKVNNSTPKVANSSSSETQKAVKSKTVGTNPYRVNPYRVNPYSTANAQPTPQTANTAIANRKKSRLERSKDKFRNKKARVHGWAHKKKNTYGPQLKACAEAVAEECSRRKFDLKSWFQYQKRYGLSGIQVRIEVRAGALKRKLRRGKVNTRAWIHEKKETLGPRLQSRFERTKAKFGRGTTKTCDWFHQLKEKCTPQPPQPKHIEEEVAEIPTAEHDESQSQEAASTSRLKAKWSRGKTAAKAFFCKSTREIPESTTS